MDTAKVKNNKVGDEAEEFSQESRTKIYFNKFFKETWSTCRSPSPDMHLIGVPEEENQGILQWKCSVF